MALAISSPSACCSRSLSLRQISIYIADCEVSNIHGLVNFIDVKLAVDLCHGFTGLRHGIKGLLIDVRRFDGIYLLLESRYLGSRLLKRVLVLLLPP